MSLSSIKVIVDFFSFLSITILTYIPDIRQYSLPFVRLPSLPSPIWNTPLNLKLHFLKGNAIAELIREYVFLLSLLAYKIMNVSCVVCTLYNGSYLFVCVIRIKYGSFLVWFVLIGLWYHECVLCSVCIIVHIFCNV